ncbi:MAG: class I SAM-dependent methyltransferase [Deltaproteobacteria bacterium]|nr:class I SAM-dependent methyltransferase [Deltaproteobacteria bacterium]
MPPVRLFSLCRCPSCGFSFVPDYRTDYDVVYSEAYYRGQGSDPLANYLFDHQEPAATLRRYEWSGLLEVFRTLSPAPPDKAKWLDYGCGLGSLVRYGRERGVNIFGCDPYGAAAGKGKLPEDGRYLDPYILAREDLQREGFDYVTAVEVIEHTADPVAFLGEIRPLLKPGGVLFLTTGNAKPFRNKFTRWSYAVCPDIHVSFFEPETLALALEKAGFRPEFRGYVKGFTEIIKYKILKNLKFTRRSRLFDLLPWPVLSRLADAKYRVTAHPVGVAA